MAIQPEAGTPRPKGTIRIPIDEGWRFIKADDPSAGANLSMQAMSALLDRADRG